MRQTVIHIILILSIPALCQGSIGPDPQLRVCDHGASGKNTYVLDLEYMWQADIAPSGIFDPVLSDPHTGATKQSLYEIKSGELHPGGQAPKDMVSMMSFIWAEMFGGVDIVAEVKDFARQVRIKGQNAKVRREQERDFRNRWRFVVAWRIDDQVEFAALLKNRGRFLGESSMAFEINALDPMSDEIGLTMAYANGEFDLRADRMMLAEGAAARLTLKF